MNPCTSVVNENEPGTVQVVAGPFIWQRANFPRPSVKPTCSVCPVGGAVEAWNTSEETVARFDAAIGSLPRFVLESDGGV